MFVLITASVLVVIAMCVVTNICIDEQRKRNRRQVAAQEPEALTSDVVESTTLLPEAPVIDWESANNICQGLRQWEHLPKTLG